MQACHAVLEAAQAFFPPQLEHPTLVICGIRDGPRLGRCLEALDRSGVRYRAFHEPDLDGELTAAATEPVYGRQRRLFRHYQLLGEQD